MELRWWRTIWASSVAIALALALAVTALRWVQWWKYFKAVLPDHVHSKDVPWVHIRRVPWWRLSQLEWKLRTLSRALSRA